MAGRMRTMRFVAIVFTLLSSASFAVAADDDSQKLVCETVDDACRHYRRFRDSFRRFRCDLKITSGESRDRKTALQGGPDAVKKKATAEAHWLVDGPREFFDLRPDHANRREERKNARGETIERVHFSPTSFVRDGNLQAFNLQDIVEIGPSRRRVPQRLLPLGLVQTVKRDDPPGSTDLIDLENRIAQARAENWKVELNRPESNASEVEITVTAPGQWRGEATALTKIAFDSSRGFIPVRFERGELGRDAADRYIVTEAIACSENRWFPKRMIEIYGRVNDTAAVSVEEILVTNLKTDLPENEKQPTLTIPKRTILLESAPRKAHFQLRETVSISPKNLAQFVKATAAQFDAVANLGEEEIVGDEDDEVDLAEGTVESATEPAPRKIIIKK